jgi:polar amino acid transport system substrate-binding protein
MNRIGSMLAAAVAAVAAVAAGCGVVPTAPSSAAKAELAPSGALRVAVFTRNPVIGNKDKATGELKGTTVALGRALAGQAGVPATLIEYTAIAKLVEDAKTGAWDIAVVAFDPARRGVLDFAPPHMVVDLTYLVAPGSAIRSVADADKPGVRIGAARGAATTLFLERTLKAARVTPAENEPAVFALLREGKVDAIAQNRFLLLGLAELLPGSRVLDDRFSVAEMTIVLPKGRSAALEFVGAFVGQARKSGLIARAIEGAGLRGVAVAQGGAAAVEKEP